MEDRFDFDDQLPDLPIAFDLDAVKQVFDEKIQQLGLPFGSQATIKVTKLQDTKYRPAVRCVTTYEMQIEPPSGPPVSTIGVLEFTPDGVMPRLYMTDSQMPWIVMATDHERMSERFAELAVQSGWSAGDIQLLTIEPVRYKPGLHCVFRYIVQTPDGAQVYYGKLFSEKSDALMQAITALHDYSEANPDMPRIPRPVTYWPEMQMVLQPAVTSGVEFTKFAYDPAHEPAEREGWMRRAGTALGVFHKATVLAEVRTIYDDLKDLDEYTNVMTRVKPKLAAEFKDVIRQIMAKIEGCSEPAPVASHGAMRTDQFILQGDRLAVIDLDGYCWSNPARDLGNFLAYLCWKAIRQPEHGLFVERAGRTFLDGYLEVQADINEHWLSIYQAASLLKIAGRRFRSLTFLEWPLIIHLIEAARSTLNEKIDNLEAGNVEGHQGTLVAHLSTSTSMTKFPATFTDKEFPALWRALNPEMMNELLTPILDRLACPDQTLSVRRAKLLAYKPGKRGVIRYDLAGTNCKMYAPVYGKLYPQAYLCERTYKVMKILSEEVFQDQPYLSVPQPLGYIPQLSMLVFIPVEGQFLRDVIESNQLNSAAAQRSMELAGAWLAQLHSHPFPLEKQFRMENEVDNIREWCDLISTKYPTEEKVARHLANYLLKQIDRLAFDVTVPIHKDFHYEHMLIDGGIKVFDFDEMRTGDPNFDLAHFSANFYLLAYRNHRNTNHFSSLQSRFFDAYIQRTGWRLGEKFIFFYVYSCLKIAKQLCKLRGPRPWPEGEEQHAQVWLMLEQGLAMLSYARFGQVGMETALPFIECSQIRRVGWTKANRISKSATSSEAFHVSHRPLLSMRF